VNPTTRFRSSLLPIDPDDAQPADPVGHEQQVAAACDAVGVMPAAQ
jgi:hypothetical protein